TTQGGSALPALTPDASGEAAMITINGNGATLQRSAAPGTPNFRLIRAGTLNVDTPMTVILNGMTLKGGVVVEEGGFGWEGGAIYATNCVLQMTDCVATGNNSQVIRVQQLTN